MGKKTIIPFGPQHPLLPEPVHFDLVVEDETVVEAIPSIGFIHRGLEKLVEKRDYNQMVYMIERISGIDSFGLSWGACLAIEGAMNARIPERAEYLRTIFQELSRLQSHLLWLGLLAKALGFESLSNRCWSLRETVLNIFEKTAGGRIILSICKVGGFRKDIDNDTLKEIAVAVKEMEAEIDTLTDVFLEDDSVKSRLMGVGLLTREEAMELCVVGPAARGSGIHQDMRMTNRHGVYDRLDFRPVVEEAGDCYARCKVRIREIFQSIGLIVKAIDGIAGGPVSVDISRAVEGEFITRLEQPGGEAFFYAKGAGSMLLQRMRVRTAANTNFPAAVKLLQGCDLADVSIILLTMDPYISGIER